MVVDGGGVEALFRLRDKDRWCLPGNKGPNGVVVVVGDNGAGPLIRLAIGVGVKVRLPSTRTSATVL